MTTKAPETHTRAPQEFHTAETVDGNTAVIALTGRKFRVPGDVVNIATAELPDEQRSAIRWLHSYATENNLSYSELATKVRYDESTLSRVFNGKYAGDLSAVCNEILALKKLEEDRATVHRTGFVKTSLATGIWKVCDAARIYQGIFGIKGDSQIGKTTALEKYTEENNHGSTIYVRMPEGGTLSYFMGELALKLRISPSLKESELRRRIITAFDDRMILIVDEAHQCLRADGAKRGLRTIEFIREIHDRAKCGIVLAMTEEGWAAIDTGRYAKMLEQLKRRCVSVRKLPARPSARDLDTFAASFGLTPAEGETLTIQTDVIHAHGLGKWLKTLSAASRVASREKAKLGWVHVVKAYAGLRSLEGIGGAE